MKQFTHIFKFEFGSIVGNKIFKVLTLVFVILLALFLSYPRIASLIKGDEKDKAKTSGDVTKIALLVEGDVSKADVTAVFKAAFSDGYKIINVNESEKVIKEKVKNKEYDNAFIVDSSTHYKYITETKTMNDYKSEIATSCMEQVYRISESIKKGLNPQEAYSIMNTQIQKDVVVIGKDQGKSFLYTYIVMMFLYMTIIIYGQFVAQSVASEKGSRTMEVLVTSAKPTNMMFGKVLGSGCAGLLQMGIMLGSGILFYSLNKEYWKDNAIVKSMFDIPKEIIPYALLLFILGFFIFAFLYGALGSIASKVEDLNSLILPVTFMLIIVFVVVMTMMGSGKADTTVMKVLSFIPFTSPFAMLVRLCMTTVPTVEIIISVAILIASVFVIGYLSAIIYRTGVLMYGNKPSIKAVFTTIKQQKK